MRRPKSISALALAAGAALVLSGCGGGGGAGGGGEQQDQRPKDIGAADELYKRPKVNDIGDVTVAVEENYHDYNNDIGDNNNFSNSRILTLVQPSPFIAVYENGKQVIKIDGDLMESIKITSTNPQTLEYKFRKEAVWSDGAPVGCKDIYLTWLAHTTKQKGADGKDSAPFQVDFTGYEQVDKVECSADGKTATVTFGLPFADYRALFSTPGQDSLLPAHVLEKNTGVADITKLSPKDPTNADLKKAAEFYTTKWNDFDPALDLSAGPYVIKSADLKDVTVLERNPKWFGNQGGPAKITIRTNSDAQSAAQQLQNKEVQVVEVQADASVSQQMRSVESVQTFTQGGQTFEHIDFNMQKPLFKENPELRLAIAQCIDRQAIVENLVKDVDPKAVPLGNFMFMPNEEGYTDHYSDLGKGDVEAAKKSLEAKGWKPGADGIYTKGEFKASFKLGHKVVQRRSDTVRLVQEKCRSAGIDIQDDQSANFNSDRLPASEFDAALFAWVGTLVKSSSFENYKTGGSGNYNKYASSKMDEKYEAANKELDFDKRKQLLDEVDKIMREDLHSIPLFQLPDFAAYDKGIKPITYVGTAGGVTWNAYEWQK